MRSIDIPKLPDTPGKFRCGGGANTRTYSERYRRLYPAASHRIGDIFWLWIIPPFAEVTTEGHVRGLPRKRPGCKMAIENTRRDIRGCTAFIVDRDEIPTHGRIEFSSTHTALKRNPDRPFGDECRAISDLRRVNLWLSKEDASPVFAPSLAGICVSLGIRYLGVDIHIAKRDISDAFRRAPVRPDCARAFVHSFDAVEVGGRSSFGIGFLALPFGFLASASYFDLATSPIQRTHQRRRHTEETWNGCGDFGDFLYIGDGIFAESANASRSTGCVHLWETRDRNVLGQECVNGEKVFRADIGRLGRMCLAPSLILKPWKFARTQSRFKEPMTSYCPTSFRKGVSL